MALITCSECGKEVSDKARTCPNCGVSLSATEETSSLSEAVSPPASPNKAAKKSGKLKYVLLAIFVVAVISTLAGQKDDKTPSGPSQNAASSAKAPKQELNYEVMSASALFYEFKQNEVAANQKFKKKRVAIEGRIHSIGSSLMEYPEIVFSVDGSHGFATVSCEFPKKAIDTIAKMSTGQHVIIIGTVKGLVISTVFLDDCIFGEAKK